jgi:antitoxin ParD1/3/4
MATLHITLPDGLEEFVKEEVREGGYATPSDYVRSLLRQAKERKARRTLDQALTSSLETPTEEVTPEYLAELQRKARELTGRKGAKSVAEATFGALASNVPMRSPREEHAVFEEGVAEEAALEGLPKRST